ncbi:MAG TPA: hypothetical protein VK611_21945 [Acidimicrobiales bacterium]|nr:hypothetical protein [Acidimicrobiales bacterium]
MSAATTPAFARDGPGWRYRVESLPVRRIQDFAIAATVVAAGAAVHAVHLADAPGRTTGEGVLVGRAWLLDGGLRTHVTDWYDHPPLGWLLLGLWTSLTSAFERAPTAIGAGRELMLVAYVASAALLWILGRRLGLRRWATAVALVVFGLVPLAVELHRQVTLDNLAVPWLLAAFALASNPRRPLVAYAGSGACLAAAVLTRETALLFLPLLVWHLRRSSVPSTRRYALVVSGTLFVLVCAAYLVPVAASGELAATQDHPGLLDGIGYRLRHLGGDEAAAGLVVMLLPAAALAVGGLAQTAWHRRGATDRPHTPLLVVAAVAATTVVAWWGVEHRLLVPDEARADVEPVVQAEAWVHANLAESPVRLVVDDAVWVDLVEAGIPVERLTGHEAIALPDDVGRPRPGEGAWADHQVVLVTPALRAAAPPDVLQGAVPLATFGSHDDRVELVRIGAPPGAVHDGTAAAGQGAELADNPSVQMTTEVRRVLVGGRVDLRLMTTLVALGTARPYQVTAFPADPAEVEAGAPRRVAELRFATPGDALLAADILRVQQPPYQPADVEVIDDVQVTVTYEPAPLG